MEWKDHHYLCYLYVYGWRFLLISIYMYLVIICPPLPDCTIRCNSEKMREYLDVPTFFFFSRSMMSIFTITERSFTVLTADIPRHIDSSNSSGILVVFLPLVSNFHSSFYAHSVSILFSIVLFLKAFYTRVRHRRIKTKRKRFIRKCFCWLGQEIRAKSHMHTSRFHGSVKMAQ